ncbi:sugar ABC transporter substrate-binding protein [Paenibacillus albiflavus]|uniref:sugar ABC transporter substrate-binding protein n=1 Tax=Paenibacillus albiflavus TaxID=2545760 RepID=UPI0026AEEA4E
MKIRKIRKMVAGLSAMTMVFALTACGGGSGSSSASSSSPQPTATPAAVSATPGPVTDELKPEAGASLVIWESKEARPYLEEIMKEFTAKYDVKVKIEELGAGDQIGKLTTDGPAGVAADVVMLPHDQLGKAVSAGLVLPNDVYGEVTTKENSEVAVKAASFGGKLYGYPKSVETYALIYNKDLVKTPPKTFDEVTAFAKTYNDPKNNKYAFMWEAGNFYFNYLFLATTGGYVFGNNGTDKNDIGLNNDGAVKGAQFYGSLAKDLLPMKSGDATYDIKKGLFTAGTLAMDINGPWTIGDYKKSGVNFGVAPIPSIDGKPSVSFSGVKAWYVNAFSKYPNAARLFARFASTKEAQMQDFKLTGALPSNKEAAQDPIIKNDELVTGFLQQFEHSYPMPAIPEMGSVWEPMAAAMSDIWNNGKDAKAALDNAVQQIKDATAKK